jgi:hypothetical protein
MPVREQCDADPTDKSMAPCATELRRAGHTVVCRPVMRQLTAIRRRFKCGPRKGWVAPPRAAAARDHSSAEPPRKTPPEIPEAVSSLIGGRVTF